VRLYPFLDLVAVADSIDLERQLVENISLRRAA
jgi:hypothetical protein